MAEEEQQTQPAIEQAAAEQAAKEAAWEKEREELYAEIGKLSTQLAWMKKMWPPA